MSARTEEILDVAANLINQLGLKGLSLSEVAKRVRITKPAVSYHFGRKELLAEACLLRALDELDLIVVKAAAGASSKERICIFVDLSFERLQAVWEGRVRPVARLADLRALENPARAVGRYFNIFRKVRAFFPEARSRRERLDQLMRAHILVETMQDLPRWLKEHDGRDHERVRRWTKTLLLNGLHTQISGRPDLIEFLTPLEPLQGGERFFDAATRLINARGYRGASVDRISAALNVTKGSFYHHLDAKDDLVLACFRHSFERIGRVHDAALQQDASAFQRLLRLILTLVRLQLGDGTPLLRSIALAALPPGLEREAMAQRNQLRYLLAGIIVDSAHAGDIEVVDSLVASSLFMAGVNAAYELRTALRGISPEEGAAMYTIIMFEGLNMP